MKSVREKYNEIEENFDKNPIQSLKDFVDLYPGACGSYDHDIADAIGLYIDDMANLEIYTYLQNKIDISYDPFTKAAFKGLIEIFTYKLDQLK